MKKLLLLIAILGTISIAPLQAQLVIGFHTGSTTAPSGGTLSYDGAGGPLVGTNFPLELLTSRSTPLNNNSSFHVSNGTLSFTTGNFVSFSGGQYTFAAGGSLTLTGGVPAVPLPDGTVLESGTTISAQYRTSGELTIVVGTDTKNPILLTFFGVPSTTPFKFNASAFAFLTSGNYDGGAFTAEGALSTDIDNQLLPMTLTCPASTGTVGTPYSSALVASGGMTPYTFSILTGALPGGLTLNSDGTITGNPNSAGPFAFTAQVTDAVGVKAPTDTASSACNIIISPPNLAALGDFVWEDLNANGQQDSGEPGIPNVVVQLYRCDNTLAGSTQTNSSGLYNFTGLNPGCYYVKFFPPAGYSISPVDTGNDTTDSDANPATGQTGQYNLAAGDNNLTVDAGLYRPAAIGDFVWEDLNNDGQQNSGEPGIPNVFVQLYKCDNTSVGTTNTDGSGFYHFTNLVPGCYYVKFTPPGGYTFSPSDVGNDASDSDADTTTGKTGDYVLPSGTTNNTVDAGLYRPASIGDTVWHDLNANGQQDSGEPGIPNVPVTLYKCDNTQVGTTNTDGNGLYSFTNLPPGCYYVKFGTPPGYIPTTPNVGGDTGDSDSVGGQTGNYTLTSGETNNTVDAGFYKLANLGDFVWHDLNANGQQDSGEPGIPNVPVFLYKCDNTPAGSTNTDGSGLYAFTNLVPGCYYVKFGTPAGYLPTTPNSGSDVTDSDSVAGQTGNYNLASGETNNTVDAGFYKLAALGDYVWVDNTNNGQQDAGEPPVPNVTVLLYKCDNTQLGSTMTNGSGLYAFTNLVPGCYYVKFVAPPSYTFTTPLTGNPQTDSDAGPGGISGPYTLASGETNNTIDAGLRPPPPSATCLVISPIAGVPFSSGPMSGSGGTGGPYNFSASGLPTGLTMAPDGSISGTTTVTGPTSYTVTVKDKDGNTATINCSVTVLAKPSAICLVISPIAGVPFSSGPMSGSGGTGGPYNFSASGLPTGLTMAADGSISGTTTVTGLTNYTVTVKDKDGNTGTINCSVTVLAKPSATCLVISPIAGVPFSSGPMSGSGGTGGPYSFSASGLPTGLTMAADGSISGTTTVTGLTNYTVTVKDKDGNTGTINCSVTVLAKPSATCLVISPIAGVPFSSGPMSGSGGTGGPYNFSASGLPTGLTMAPDGSISGTTTVTGLTNYTVTVKDKDGNTGTINCSVTVLAKPSATCLVISPIAGVPFSSGPMSGSGGTGGPYNFSASGLPTGLTMAADGSISGTTTVTGLTNYTVTVKDKDGNTGTINCSVTVAPPTTPLTLLCPTGTGQTGVLYSSTPVVSGAIGLVTFSIASGVLPTGLTLNPTTGLITGTPTVAGVFSFTLKVTDSAGRVALSSCTASCGPTITNFNFTSPLGVLPVSQPYTVNGITITAYGFSNANAPKALYGRNDAGNEAGLGIAGTAPDNEIDVNNYVQLDLGALLAAGATSGTMVVNSVQTGESFNVYGSNALGSIGTLLLSAQTANNLPFAIPSFGTYRYVSVRASAVDVLLGAVGATLPASCNITITSTVSSSCVAINAFQNVAITPVTMVGAGGAGGPYTFSATGLPAGLTMSTTGTISGTPTVSGTFAYTVTIKDKNGNTGTVNCSVTVLTVPSASCVAITALQNVAITPVTMVGTGGAGAPYTFTATGLPAGLTMSTTGTISGTPTVSGTFAYVVTVKDKSGNSGTVNCSVTVTPQVVCAATVFDLTGGSSSSTGTFGNIRTYTAPNGVQVKISAFSRNKSTSAWSTAWLGAYAPGLGVTNNSESGTDPSHKVDNVGTQNDYVLMEFSQPVILDRAYLDYVTTDSDMTIWIGNKTAPFTNHNTLSDSFLTSLGYTEENDTTLTTARWADVNSGHLSGNVIVIAASIADTTPDDYFKISKLQTECLPSVTTPTASCVSISATQNTAITPATLVGAGGAGGPYTFSATGLPAGLTMSSAGIISGTPTVSGTFNYTVTVKDKNNVAGTFVCSITVLPQAVCAPSTFDFTSTTNSASTGTAGNIRTFTASNGVQVKVSGFARNKSNGAWSTAWLGSYTPGLGVTDSTESGADPTHKVDNVGTQVNYVLMEFSQNIVINRAFLDYVGADSDIQVWIGTKTNPFANHISLSDATLTGLGYTENNLTTSPDARWADVNAGNLSGNVIVIAALPTDGDDEFKLSKLDISCTAPTASVVTPVSLANSYNINGIYTDGTTFTGGGLDGSGYAYSSNLLGTSLTWNTTPFNFGPASGSDVVDGSAAVIALPPGNFSAVRLLATAVNGNQAGQTFLVTYTDGTTSTFTQSMSDWLTPQNYAGESIAKAMAYRNGSAGTKDNRTFNLYGYSFTLNTAKTVASIKLPASANVEVLAVTLVP